MAKIKKCPRKIKPAGHVEGTNRFDREDVPIGSNFAAVLLLRLSTNKLELSVVLINMYDQLVTTTTLSLDFPTSS